MDPGVTLSFFGFRPWRNSFFPCQTWLGLHSSERSARIKISLFVFDSIYKLNIQSESFPARCKTLLARHIQSSKINRTYISLVSILKSVKFNSKKINIEKYLEHFIFLKHFYAAGKIENRQNYTYEYVQLLINQTPNNSSFYCDIAII